MSKDLFVGIDLSLRNSAICILDKDKNLVDFAIVSNNDLTEEALLNYNMCNILSFICKNDNKAGLVKYIALEELSFNSPSSMADLIAANKWVLRVGILNEWPEINVKQVSVKEWRSKVVSKEEQNTINNKYPIIRARRGFKLSKDEQKSNNKNKAIIKKETKEITVSKLPKEVKEAFELYIDSNKYKKDSIFDLCDGYFVCSWLVGKHNGTV